MSAGLPEEEARQDKIQVADYVKMRENDGTVSGLYNLLTLPILSSSYSFVADDKDANGEQADFIKEALDKPPHRGGMTIPFGVVLADMLRGVIEGFRVYELVLGINAEGKIIFEKIAPRDGSQSSQSIILKRNDKGNFDGFHQRVTYQGKYVDVQISEPNSFLFTYAKDKNFLYGESAFKAAYYHYKKKHKAYYLVELQANVGAVPPRVITGPSGIADNVKKKVLSEFAKLGVMSTAYKSKDYTVEPYDSKSAQVDLMPYIDHQDTQMARSILAQFLMLGTTSKSAGGSHALSSDQSELFIMALKGVMTTIETHINYYLIPKLIDLNFAEPAYPTFHFEDLTSDAKQIVTDAFTQLVTSGSVSEAMVKGLESRVAEALDIDLDAEQKIVDAETAKKISDAKANGVEVDAKGNPVPPPAAPVPKAGEPVNPKAQPVKMSSEGDGDDPKVLTSQTAGGGVHSHRSSSVFRSLR